jgi:hypothetical protein
MYLGSEDDWRYLVRKVVPRLHHRLSGLFVPSFHAGQVAKVTDSTSTLIVIASGEMPTGQHQRAIKICGNLMEILLAHGHSLGQSMNGNVSLLNFRPQSINGFFGSHFDLLFLF